MISDILVNFDSRIKWMTPRVDSDLFKIVAIGTITIEFEALDNIFEIVSLSKFKL